MSLSLSRDLSERSDVGSGEAAVHDAVHLLKLVPVLLDLVDVPSDEVVACMLGVEEEQLVEAKDRRVDDGGTHNI